MSSLPSGEALTLYVGRKGVTSPTAQLENVSYGAFSPLYTPQAFATLDATSYGGFSSKTTVGTGWNPRFLSPTAANARGVYHLLARVQTAETTPNLPLISLRVVTTQQTDPWLNLPDGSDIVGEWDGAFVAPFTASNTWIVADAGQCVLPPFP